MTNTIEKFRLDGRIAIVTGGNGNLGPWWVKALEEAGAIIAVIDLPDTRIPADLQKIGKSNIRVYKADIIDMNQLDQVHKQISTDFGPVEILVNNAGIDASPVKSKEKTDPKMLVEEYKKMWDVNVQGMVNCIEEFAPDMEKLKKGSIINIGSLYMERSPYEGLYTHLGFDKPWAYGATKAAVGQVTRHYATRLAKYGIRVNTLSPGGVLENQDKEFIRRFSTRVPQARMAQKETDLGGPLVFLASDASSYITGINLQVNGGYTAW